MKRIVAAVLTFSLLFLVACGANSPGGFAPSGSSFAPQPTQNLSLTPESMADVLDGMGIEYETTMMAAMMIGAESGMMYEWGDSRVEVYRYDTDSEVYKTAEKDQKILLGTMIMDATVQDGFAFMFGVDVDDTQVKEILSKFFD